jgi:competence protein ComEC
MRWRVCGGGAGVEGGKRWDDDQGIFMKKRIGLACLWTGLVVGLVAPRAFGGEPKPLELYWVDVEGGAATLLVTPAGESVLMDTGMPGARDPGRIVEVATKLAGLKQIDHLVVSHFHIDHFGGAAEVAQSIPVGTVYDSGVPERNPDNNPQDTRWPLTIKPYREMKVGRRVVLQAGDVIPLRQVSGQPMLRIRCLAGRQRVVAPPVPATAGVECDLEKDQEVDRSDNANSLVLLAEFGDFQFFCAGDLTWNVEKSLVCPVNVVGEVDVYQVTHHGLDASNHPAVVRSLRPTVAVMSNGTRKGCGPKTFATLKRVSSIEAIYQIHRNLREDREVNAPDDYIANLEADCRAHPIRMTVDSSAKTFTVRLPGNGHQRSYKVK